MPETCRLRSDGRQDFNRSIHLLGLGTGFHAEFRTRWNQDALEPCGAVSRGEWTDILAAILSRRRIGKTRVRECRWLGVSAEIKHYDGDEIV